MKSKNKILLFLTLIIHQFAISQNDTVFFNDLWDTVAKSEAVYYRLPMTQIEGKYYFKDFYITGELQCEGYILSPTNEIIDGKTTWYYKSGKVSQISQLNNGSYDGETIWYEEDGTELCRGMYNSNIQDSGTFFTTYDNYRILTEYKNGEPSRIQIIDMFGGTKAKIETFPTTEELVKTLFYNQEGIEIGNLLTHFATDSIVEGIFVDYFYNPMTVKSLVSIKNNKFTSPRKNYDKKGRLLYIEHFAEESYSSSYFENSSIDKIDYYGKNGKKIDSLQMKNDVPFSGKLYSYAYDDLYNKTDIIESIIEYKNGIEDGLAITYYANGIEKKKIPYSQGNIHGEVIENDSTGKVLYKMQYENGRKCNGLEMQDDILTEYRNCTNFSDKSFYSNKKLKATILYDSLENFKTTYYNKKGQQIGEYTQVNYVTNGVEFLFNEDTITEKKVYVDNSITEHFVFQGTDTLYCLRSNGKCFFIDNILKWEWTMKNNEPFNGNYVTLSYYNNSITSITEYKDGMKNGLEKSFSDDYYSSDKTLISELNYKNNELNGISSYYNYGILYKQETYLNGLKHGETNYFDSENNIIGTCIYESDMVISGSVYEYNYDGAVESVETYENSQLKESIYYNSGIVTSKEKVINDDSIRVETYYDNGTIKELKYKVKQDEDYSFNISGIITTYKQDESVWYTGTYSNNLPLSGNFIFFNSTDDEQYLKMTIEKKNVLIEHFSYGNVEEKIKYSYSKNKLSDDISSILDMIYSKYYDYEIYK
ncbi:MAG: hypothetical protein IPO21_05780 [Bacteroidales bacterium]|nr:hypothetical protein [Bacteroidales bacterium]